MFQLGNTIISEDILDNDFVCNLKACKGACCVEGDAGAPLEKEEVEILREIYPKVKPFLKAEGIAAIEAQGTSIETAFGDLETPLVEGKECAYTIFTDNGKAFCGIEKAYLEGAIDWKKPISCHLYPIRAKDYTQFTAINYNKWDICDDACVLGASLEVPVYKFVKEALIRKFGKDWYRELEILAEKRQELL